MYCMKARMNTRISLFLAVALAVAGAAHGAEKTDGHTDDPAPAQQQSSRADVHAQAVEARRNGSLDVTEADTDVAQTKKHIAR